MSVEVPSRHTFDMARLFARLAVPGRDLVMRSFGERALPLLEEALGVVAEGGTLALDLYDIMVMDASFADATIVSLQQGLIAGKYGDKFFLLVSPNETIVVNLEGALARRNLKQPLLISDSGHVSLLGHIERNLREAWDLVVSGRVTRARELADELGIEIGAASMRLHKLYVARLLARREEVIVSGRQHVYQSPL